MDFLQTIISPHTVECPMLYLLKGDYTYPKCALVVQEVETPILPRVRDECYDRPLAPVTSIMGSIYPIVI